jgi:hypothetical protein
MANDNLQNDSSGNDRESAQDPENRSGWKSKWVESTAPSADDPMSPEEMQGHNLLGNSSLRGGAIAGVSDPVRDGHAAPGERPDDIRLGSRTNPPELDDIPGEGGVERNDS